MPELLGIEFAIKMRAGTQTSGGDAQPCCAHHPHMHTPGADSPRPSSMKTTLREITWKLGHANRGCWQEQA
jgi:hypothetical protein